MNMSFIQDYICLFVTLNMIVANGGMGYCTCRDALASSLCYVKFSVLFVSCELFMPSARGGFYWYFKLQQ